MTTFHTYQRLVRFLAQDMHFVVRFGFLYHFYVSKIHFRTEEFNFFGFPPKSSCSALRLSFSNPADVFRCRIWWRLWFCHQTWPECNFWRRYDRSKSDYGMKAQAFGHIMILNDRKNLQNHIFVKSSLCIPAENSADILIMLSDMTCIHDLMEILTRKDTWLPNCSPVYERVELGLQKRVYLNMCLSPACLRHAVVGMLCCYGTANIGTV